MILERNSSRTTPRVVPELGEVLTRPPVIVPALEPVIKPVRDPVITPAREPVALVLPPVMVPPYETVTSDRVKVAAVSIRRRCMSILLVDRYLLGVEWMGDVTASLDLPPQ